MLKIINKLIMCFGLPLVSDAGSDDDGDVAGLAIGLLMGDATNTGCVVVLAVVGTSLLLSLDGDGRMLATGDDVGFSVVATGKFVGAGTGCAVVVNGKFVGARTGCAVVVNGTFVGARTGGCVVVANGTFVGADTGRCVVVTGDCTGVDGDVPEDTGGTVGALPFVSTLLIHDKSEANATQSPIYRLEQSQLPTVTDVSDIADRKQLVQKSDASAAVPKSTPIVHTHTSIDTGTLLRH
jgi:hypothetical protein